MTTISTHGPSEGTVDEVRAAGASSRLAARSAARSRLAGRVTWHGIERGGTFLLPLALYLWTGVRLALVVKGLPGDALSRTAAASSTMLGRDPHLEAIGFVWGPFPTLWQVPIVWLGRGWHSMVADGVAGVIASATLMATMISVTRRCLEECGLGAATRLALVAVLALNPFILLYGSNGMSEAGLLCFGVIAARRLARWWERGRAADLVVCGVALSFAYLTRYEALASIAVVVVAVAWMGYREAAGSRADRARSALLHGAAVGAPPMFAVVLWAMLSWAIVGEPLAQFTSQYGNSAQVRSSAKGIADAVGSATAAGRAWFFIRQLLTFGSLSLVACVLLVWFGTRAGARIGAAAAVLVPCLAFNFLSATAGSTYGWGRYVIVAVPLGVLLMAPFVRSIAADSRQSWAAAVAPFVAVALAAGAAYLGYAQVRDGSLQSAEEEQQLSAVPAVGSGTPSRSPQSEGSVIAADLDRMHIGRGKILTDAAITFPVVMASRDQAEFVVPSDREFEQILAAPTGNGVTYLLVSDQSGAQFDAVGNAFPEVYADGGGIARRVAEWGDARSLLRLRLYRLGPEAP